MKVDAIKLWPNLPGDKPLTFLDFLLSNCLPMDLQIMFLANFEKKIGHPYKRQIFTRFETFLEPHLRIKIVL